MFEENFSDILEYNNFSTQQFNAIRLVNCTEQSFIILGKAGTGKSRIIKFLKKYCTKKIITLTPTGIAAINVGGETIHSFFQFPTRPLLLNDREIVAFKKGSNKRLIIENLETIIIDEVSMVRSDLLDAIDYSLRLNCNKLNIPFGGKQIVLIGDIFQLPPVLNKNSGEFEILKQFYDSFYFFEAKAFNEISMVIIDLKKVFRQCDPEFIKILGKVRNKSVSGCELDLLNTRYKKVFNQEDIDFSINLTTTNNISETINREYLDRISGKSFFFKAKIKGEFTDSFPTNVELEVKEGAQIMFIKNDLQKRWVNGTIGIISSLQEETISVRLHNGNNEKISKEKWTKKKYKYDRMSGKIVEEELGSFEQYPIKLAWAITIHKSQGLTFDRAIIDLGSGAFSSGQVYVALSRLKTLEGLLLRTKKIELSDIILADEILNYEKKIKSEKIVDCLPNSEDEKNTILSVFYYEKGMDYLANGEDNNACKYFSRSYNTYKLYKHSDYYTDIKNLLERVLKHSERQKISNKILMTSHSSRLNRIWWNNLEVGWKNVLISNLGLINGEFNGGDNNLDDIDLEIMRNIEILKIDYHSCYDISNLKPIYNLKKIKALSIDNTSLSVDFDPLIFKNLPNLEIIELYHFYPLDVSEIKLCKKLKVISWICCYIENIFNILNLKSLEFINLYRSTVNDLDEEVYKIITLPKLRKLDIGNSVVNVDDFKKMVGDEDFSKIELIDGSDFDYGVGFIPLLEESDYYKNLNENK